MSSARARPAAGDARAAAAVALALGVLALAAAPARAQSTRYPPPPADPDAAAEDRSAFWEAALDPGLGRYRDLVDQARRLIELRDPGPLAEAEELLAQATQLAPGRGPAWWYLGVAREARGDWPGCADAYAHAWAIDPAATVKPALRARPELDHALAVCLARTGKLDDARRHLERLAQGGDVDSEVWLRLGEVYMGLGRLADAIDALARAAEDASISADVHWALAVAYDRARRDDDAEPELDTALRLDPTLTRVAAPMTPYLSDAESFYYQGLASKVAGLPERAVVDLRQFVALAPRSPWRARAEQHLADLAATDWPARLELQGTSAIDRAKAVAALRAGWPAIEACLRGRTGLLVQVKVVMLAPSSGPSPGAPPPGTRATAFTAYGEADADVARALACVEDAAAKVAFPRPSAVGGFARVQFAVVSR